jgi:hypothetical protein
VKILLDVLLIVDRQQNLCCFLLRRIFKVITANLGILSLDEEPASAMQEASIKLLLNNGLICL